MPGLKHEEILNVKSGNDIMLDAGKSRDPDKDNLTYEWIHYKEVGSHPEEIKINNDKQVNASFKAPKVEKEESLHIILAVTDTGEPPLTRYKRIIVNVNP